MWSALWKIPIRIRILVFGVTQIDEIDIIVIVVLGSGNGPNRERASLAAKTSEGFLLLCNISDHIGAFTRGVIHVATTKAFPIQFCHDEILSRFNG